MSTLTKRVVTALILLALIVYCLFFAPDGAAKLLLVLFLFVGVWEWTAFVTQKRVFLRLLYALSLLIIAAYLYISLSSQGAIELVFWLAMAWWLCAAVWLFRFDGSASKLLTACAGYLVLIPAFFAALSLLDFQQGEWLFVWIVAIVAGADIGAYFVGKRIGRHKLAPSISPGKTREGVYGGLVTALLVGCAGAAALDRPMLWFASIAGLVAIFSVVGDLTMSAFKRQARLKDSGVLLPGHGGVLDRIDGLVAALPLFLLALQWAES